jgi:Geminivirus Rep catalytic domain.
MALEKDFETEKPDKLDLKDGDQTYHGNYQSVKSDEHVIKYVTKDGNFISSKSIEDLLLKHQHRVGKKKIIGTSILGCTSVGELALVVRDKHPELIVDYEKIVRSYQLYQAHTIKQQSTVKPRGIWISGQPGIGKTHCLLESLGEDVYLKSQNKWWDGYTG